MPDSRLKLFHPASARKRCFNRMWGQQIQCNDIFWLSSERVSSFNKMLYSASASGPCQNMNRRLGFIRKIGVISNSFFKCVLVIYIFLFFESNKTKCLSHLLPLNNRRSQLCTFLAILSFFQLKIVLIWYESPGCADMVVKQYYWSMVADMITALTHTIVKHRKIEPLNLDVWKMRMQLLQDLFFYYW